MYRAAVEGLLGLRRRPGGIEIDPSLPEDWPGFSATLTLDGTAHEFRVARNGSEVEITIDRHDVRRGFVALGPKGSA